MNSLITKRSKSRKGLTLFESLIAMVIVLIVMLLLNPVFSAIYRGYNISTAKFLLTRDAAAITNAINTKARFCYNVSIPTDTEATFYELTNTSNPPVLSDFTPSVANTKTAKIVFDLASGEVRWYNNASILQYIVLSKNVVSFLIEPVEEADTSSGSSVDVKNRIKCSFKLSKNVNVSSSGGPVTVELPGSCEASLRCRSAEPPVKF